MPIFDYKCNCGHSEEKFIQRSELKDTERVQCPICGKNSLARLLGGADSLVELMVPIVKEVKTLGQLGEANYRKNKGKINEREAKIAENKKVKDLTQEDYQLMHASKAEIKKYVETGIRPLPKNKLTKKEKKEIANERKLQLARS